MAYRCARARDRLAAALLGVSLLTPFACEVKPKAGARPGAPAASLRAWPFVPERIDVHPLTRIVASAERGAQILAHIEMRDRFGDDVKAVGELLIELYDDIGPVEGVGERRQVDVWRFDLADLDANRRAYDPVTRTYRLELTEVRSESLKAARALVVATLITPSGSRLTAQRRVPISVDSSP